MLRLHDALFFQSPFGKNVRSVELWIGAERRWFEIKVLENHIQNDTVTQINFPLHTAI